MDRNIRFYRLILEKWGRSLRGNVDRNLKRWGGEIRYSNVVPYVGTWIEMSMNRRRMMLPVVVPYVGTWIEIILDVAIRQDGGVVPYVGTWIEMMLTL